MYGPLPYISTTFPQEKVLGRAIPQGNLSMICPSSVLIHDKDNSCDLLTVESRD